MPKIDIDAIEPLNATGYPAPFNEPVAGRWQRRLGARIGLTALGASHVTLKPGAWSSQRHWHRGEADCVFICVGAGERDAGGAYSDIDMIFTADGYKRKDGTPYPTKRLR